MITYYYALVDSNGVLCVDQMGDHDTGGGDPQTITEETVRQVADAYKHVIYFTVEHD